MATFFTGLHDDYHMPSDDASRISGTTRETPADRAGLKPGDLIVAFNGKSVRSVEDHTVLLYAHKPGDSVTLMVRRGSETLDVQVVLAGVAGDG